MRLFWLASYPKSGNTWVRFLLANYMLESPATSAAQVSDLIPDLHVAGQVNQAIDRDPDPLFVKTHLPFSEKHPLANQTEGFVYIIRRPEDVLYSNYNYHMLGSDRPAGGRDITLGQYARAFIHHGGDPRWHGMGFGTIEEHAASWIDGCDKKHVICRYKDLKKNTAEILAKIIRMTGEEPDHERIKRAVAASTFDQMRAIEVRDKTKPGGDQDVFAGDAKSMRKGRYFMNKGQSGQTLEQLGDEVQDAFDSRFEDLKSRFGYN